MTQFQMINVDEVLTCLKTAVRLAQTEEDLRVRASGCIEERILKPLGIAQIGRYEYTFVSGGRADALYGHVIIEYKVPGKLSSERDVIRAKEQVIKYIMKEAEVENRYKNFLGIIISDRIAFVRYNPATKQWMLRGPYDINRETTIKLIEAIRGLRRKKLGVEELLTDFGKHPKTKRMSSLAVKGVKTLYYKLTNAKSPRTKDLFKDWKRLFSQATGYSPGKLKGLEKEYEFRDKEIDYDALLFSIHTYYALIMKFLAAEIAYLYGAGKWLRSYVAKLEDAYMRGIEELKRVLDELESGGVFKEFLGITNFIEGDYFSWYLDELDQELADVIAEVARKLADYEPATPQLEPETTRDLLKRLYQYLVPKKIRRDLGEYYTPDWLAELVLDEVGYTEEYFEELAKKDPIAPFKLRILDPASGSGTFLILAIKRLRNYAEKHFMLDMMVDYVLKNIVGYDLNPLAVLAARTNYLLSIADILSYVRGEKEIPVYLADSLVIEESSEWVWDSNTNQQYYKMKPVAGEFKIPKYIIDNGLLSELLNLIEFSLRKLYSPDEFIKKFESKIAPKLKDVNIDYNSIKEFYNTLLDLENTGRNHVWISIIRNAFAPLLKGKFDYVVGNPPWVNWENLPETYRNITREFWDNYGLTMIKGKTGIGKVKRDLAMLFLVRTLDLYLKDGGRHGFLIPFTLFKTQAGAGFRKFLARGKKVNNTLVKGRVEVVHDLVTLYPFEGAVNRTALIVLRKGEETTFPVRHIVWDNSSGRPIDPEATLEEVKKMIKRYEISLIPLEGSKKPESSWMQITPDAYKVLSKIIAKTSMVHRYRAHAGVYTGLNQVYWVQIKDKGSDNLMLVTNSPLPGQKKKVRQTEALVEADLIYPLIRGREVKKWYARTDLGYILLPIDKKGDTLPSSLMKIRYPNAWSYFLEFFNDLITRGGEPYKSKLKPYRELRFDSKIELIEKITVVEKLCSLLEKICRSIDKIKNYYPKLKETKNCVDKIVLIKELCQKTEKIKDASQLLISACKQLKYREKTSESRPECLPFYWLFNVTPSLSNYKVVWKRIAGAITGKAVSFVATVIEPIKDKWLGKKPIIPNDSLIMVPLSNAEEAYYLAGILNSTIVRLAIASYTYELRQETHILDYIHVPKFDPGNSIHKKVAELSRKAHKLAREIYELGKKEQKEELKKVEEELDVYVAKLYGITNDELKEIKEMFAILSGEEYIEEETITEDVEM